jgi:hypothetical protein
MSGVFLFFGKMHVRFSNESLSHSLKRITLVLSILFLPPSFTGGCFFSEKFAGLQIEAELSVSPKAKSEDVWEHLPPAQLC